jgi:hypothetical protein
VSIAVPLDGAKLHAPSFERNVEPLCALLLEHAPREGAALEIASGTGQHVVAFARALPGLDWQPTEISSERRASIDAWAQESRLPNIRPARHLDAAGPDWAEALGGYDLVTLCNLLHLMTERQARAVVTGAVAALSPRGRFVLYGPFQRAGRFTSPGDAAFHAQITAANPEHGYKNDTDIEAWLAEVGASRVKRVEMPANNLAFVAAR